MNKINWSKLIPYFFLLFLVMVPLFLSSYWTRVLTEALIWCLVALSMNLLFGYLGLPSFGHATFWGVAMYTIVILVVRVGVEDSGLHSFFLLMSCGILAATITGAIFGLLVARLSGVPFLMVTLALGQMVWAIAWRWRSVTGGSESLVGLPRPDFGLSWSMSDARNFYYLVLIFFLISLFLLYRIVKSPFGNALVGIRENESRMRALGYDVWMYKYCAYVLAATFSGVAGALYAYHSGFATVSELSWFKSGLVMLMVMAGGLYNFYGPIVGVVLILGLKYVLGAYIESWSLVLGVIFVLTVMYAPRGIAGYFNQMMAKRMKIWKL